MDIASSVGGLMELGLTRYEATAYLALIGRRDATPAEIARIGPIPRQRAYDVLAALGERGLVVQVPGQALRYRAQPPDTVVERLIGVRRRELDRLAETMAEAAGRLLPLFRRGQAQDEPFDYVEVLRDRAHAAERVDQLWAEARRDVLTLVRPPILARTPPEEAALPAGVVPRTIYERALLDDPAMAELVRTYAGLGEDIRLAPALPLKLTIVDGRTVAFNLPDPVEGDGSVTTVVVHHEALAAMLTVAFDAIWSHATPLAEVADA